MESESENYFHVTNVIQMKPTSVLLPASTRSTEQKV